MGWRAASSIKVNQRYRSSSDTYQALPPVTQSLPVLESKDIIVKQATISNFFQTYPRSSTVVELLGLVDPLKVNVPKIE